MLYGISYPSGFFFKYDMKTGRARTYHDTAPSEKDLRTYHGFALKPKDYLSADLIVDNQGRVYGSEPINRLFYYDPKTDSIHVLKDQIPFVWGRHVLGRVDAWAKSKNGILYGGNGGDGQLFRLDPSTGKVANLGKPIMMNRLKALAFGANGKLYGIAGASPGYAHLFTYDADGRGFYDLGNPQFEMVAPGIEQGISWRGFQIATLAASPDGKYMVMGEDESLSQLMVFPITKK
jgi:WD40 repeat protein